MPELKTENRKHNMLPRPSLVPLSIRDLYPERWRAGVRVGESGVRGKLKTRNSKLKTAFLLFLLVTLFSALPANAATPKIAAAGGQHTVAINSDGTLWTWGYNGDGQLGDGTTVNKSSPVQIGTGTTWLQIAASGNDTVALKSRPPYLPSVRHGLMGLIYPILKPILQAVIAIISHGMTSIREE